MSLNLYQILKKRSDFKTNLLKLLAFQIAALGIANSAFAEHESGVFDYYILALTWNSGWCEIEGNRKNAPQCDQSRDFTLHGLWPQYKEGWPEYCQSARANPSRAETRRQSGLYGTSGSAWHQWNKHGRCTDMNYQEYYARSKTLIDEFQTPRIFFEVNQALDVTPEVIESAIIEANPDLTADGISVICKNGFFTEARICLDRNFEPTSCLGRAANDCSYSPTLLPIE